MLGKLRDAGAKISAVGVEYFERPADDVNWTSALVAMRTMQRCMTAIDTNIY
jgi:hypothetical protein